MATIPAGTILYHGTASAKQFTKPAAPAWFTTDRTVAAAFVFLKPDKRQFVRPRILQYTVTKPIEVLQLSHAQAREFHSGEFDGWFSKDAAQKFCEVHGFEYDGWSIPELYSEWANESMDDADNRSDDIMLCQLDKLKFVGEEPTVDGLARALEMHAGVLRRTAFHKIRNKLKTNKQRYQLIDEILPKYQKLLKDINNLTQIIKGF